MNTLELIRNLGEQAGMTGEENANHFDTCGQCIRCSELWQAIKRKVQ